MRDMPRARRNSNTPNMINAITYLLRTNTILVSIRQFRYAPFLAVAMILMFVRSLVMARLLDLPAFATYSAGLLVSSSFGALGCLGVQLLLQRELPVMIVHRRESAGCLLVMQCVLTATGCFVIGAVVIMVGGIHLAGLPPAMLLLALIHGLAMQLFLVASVESRSRGQTMRYARQNLGRAVIILFAGAAVAGWVGGAAHVLFVEAVSSLVISGLIYRRQLHAISMHLNVTVTLAWRRLFQVKWSSALIILFVSLIGFLLMNADRWIAAECLSTHSFAQYSFAWTTLTISQSIQLIINSALFPSLARQFAINGPVSAFNTSIKTSLGILAGGVLFALPVWLVLDQSVGKWFPAYQEARALLPIFIALSIIRLSDFWSSYLLVVGRETLLLKVNLSGLSVAVAAWCLWKKIGTNSLLINQIAFFALSLAVGLYAFSGWAAWHFSRKFMKESI